MVLLSADAFSQRRLIQDAPGKIGQLGNNFSGAAQGSGSDSLQRRDRFEDSITIRFRYPDSTRTSKIDSSIVDFTDRWPIPANHVFLGNTGTATRSILFSPRMQSGWDAGFHAFDVYRYSLEKARFFTTTRPYSEISYMIGTRTEQFIELVHTQNIKPNWNASGQYRLISSPGTFNNQKTNHNNYILTSWFQTVDKRYNIYGALIANKIQAGENGGIKEDENYLHDPVYKDRHNIPTNIGGDPEYSSNFFSTDVGSGNRYKDFTLLMRQQYDFGKKDSLVTDSTVIPLFYPRLRLEYSFQYNTYKYNFRDYIGDSIYYKDNYGLTLGAGTDTLELTDKWKEFINDFSIYQYPDAKNLHQFIKLGAAIQNFSLFNLNGSNQFYNIFGHAEYRNRTRDQKWDIEAKGNLYFTGFNAGDYHAYLSLQRFVGKNRSYALLGFENVNRTPSFLYDQRSRFYLTTPADFKKENTARLFASLFPAALKLKLEANYYAVTNYTYITDFYHLQQETSLFTVLQISAQKIFRIGRRWFWHADVYFQQPIGNAPVNLPLIFTRNRIGYEGKLGFKNLDIAFGAEVKYATPYKADAYSPVLGQYYYQDSIQINNPMPDISAYIHFRIRSFKLYARAENVNTVSVEDGFRFTNNNIAAPGYPYPGLILRLGIFWSFVN